MRFTKEHEWITMKENLAIVGITNFAQKQLGDVVSVELPKVGDEFKQMEVMAIIDSVKASSDIYCPVDAEIIETNDELLDHPELVNQSPYESGWIVKIKPLNSSQINGLMTKEQYSTLVGEN